MTTTHETTRHRLRCPTRDCGACRSCKLRQAWADGKFAGKRKSMRGDHWTPEQDDQLRAIVGTVPWEQLAAVWLERTSIPRTAVALRIRSKRIGVSTWAQGWSMRDLERVFGVSHHTIVRHWITLGHLVGTRWSGRGPNAGWWFDRSEIERFVHETGWLYDIRTMQAGHPMTRLAEMVAKADPWLRIEDLARYVGITATNLRRWAKRGVVPYQRRPKAGCGGQIMIRGRDFPVIRDAIRAAQADARRRAAIHGRRNCTGGLSRDARGRLVAA